MNYVPFFSHFDLTLTILVTNGPTNAESASATATARSMDGVAASGRTTAAAAGPLR